MPAVEPVMMIDASIGKMRHRRGHRVHDADEVDVSGIDEIHRVGFAHGHRQDAGVGHHDVEAAQVPDPASRASRSSLRSRTSAWRVTTRRPSSLTALSVSARSSGGGQRVGIRLDLATNVHCDDVGPFLRQTDGMAATLPPAGTGDERDLAFQATSHFVPPVVVVTVVRRPASVGRTDASRRLQRPAGDSVCYASTVAVERIDRYHDAVSARRSLDCSEAIEAGGVVRHRSCRARRRRTRRIARR